MFSSKTNTPTEKSTQKNVLAQGTEVKGDVKASKLIVEPGAIFNANCNMNTGIKTPTNNVTAPVQPKKIKKTEQKV